MRFSTVKISSAIAVVILTWSSAYVAIRAGLKGYHPGSMALLRYLVASVCMLILHHQTVKMRKVTKSELVLLILLGLFGFGIYNVALNYGEISVQAGIASFIIGLIPAIIIVLAVFFLKEKLSPIQWIGAVISLLGIVIIAIGESEWRHFNFGLIYIFIAAISAAIYVILQKPLLKKFNPIELTTYAILAGTILMLIYTPEMLHDITHASVMETGLVIYLGIFPAALGYLCWSYVLSNFPASKASALLYIMPIATTALGWILLGEIPTLLSLLGGSIALIGAIIVNKSKPREKEPLP